MDGVRVCISCYNEYALAVTIGAGNTPMSKASPEMQELARRLVALEAVRDDAPASRAGAAMRVIEELRLRLIRLVGIHGFHTLLSRALALARTEVPVLETVRINADGFVEGRDETEPGREATVGATATATEGQGGTVLVAHLLELLVTFIGESLTLHLVRDAWPEASLNGADLRGEKTP